jgi:hypothetical protein
LRLFHPSLIKIYPIRFLDIALHHLKKHLQKREHQLNIGCILFPKEKAKKWGSKKPPLFGVFSGLAQNRSLNPI